MSRYCVKCGKELRSEAVFCPHCGERVSYTGVTNSKWEAMSENCIGPCQMILKIFLYLMAGGLIFVCMLSGISALVIGGFFFYHFATTGYIFLPTFLASELGISTLCGVPLIFAGITVLFVALLLIAAAVTMIRALMARHKKHTAV
ncbi:zinc ribbon domain-containing protein [Parablautia intestinalis]|jgi:hypothetical protein|uniref:zinc ribbon domain-containing protein n=1 Tax=Parablautia intestinalis TaxID=2320100 RepID=UPI00256F3E63|nr:zinc ribbon domain-containing protein [Parablautia intestinalis]